MINVLVVVNFAPTYLLVGDKTDVNIDHIEKLRMSVRLAVKFIDIIGI